MNRHERRVQAALSRVIAQFRPDTLTPIPQDRWPVMNVIPIQAWESKDFCVLQYDEGLFNGDEMYRLSICRTTLRDDGKWEENISWDELMRCKNEVGFGDWYGVEIYPRDKDIVNVANMRHLWIFGKPLNIGWFKL